MSRRYSGGLFVVILVWLLAAWSRPACAQELTPLELGRPLERQCAGGESHHYRLRLEAGQYVKVEVFQYWISVELRLFDPAGKMVVELKLHNEDAQTEMLSAITDQSGDFKLEVKARGAKEIRSTYTILLVKRQMATPQDRLLVEADRMQIEAYRLARQRKWEEGKALSEKAVGVYEQVYGLDHPELIEPLKLLAVLLLFKTDLPALEAASQRILSIRERSLGPDHLDVSDALIFVANSQLVQGKDAQARLLFERALRIREAHLGPDDMRIAQMAMNLGFLDWRLSAFVRAETMYQRAKAIARKTLGPVSYIAFEVRNNLGDLLATQGNYAEAQAVWEEGVTGGERAFPDSPVLGVMLRNLGQLHLDMGYHNRARPLLERALPIFEKSWGAESTNFAGMLALLGRLNLEQGQLASAEEFCRRALALHEKIYYPNPDHFDIAPIWSGLARVLLARKQYDQAEAAYERARSINEKNFTEKDWRWGLSMRDLGKLHQAKGEYVKAEEFIRRAAASYEASLGSNHPYAYEARRDLMRLCLAQGRAKEALTEQQQASEISEYSLSRNLMAGSENQKLRFLEKFASEVDDTLSLHTRVRPTDAPALNLAIQTLLRRKGRALDEMGATTRLLRQRASGHDLKLFDQLSDKLTQLSVLTTRGAEARKESSYLEQVKQVNEEIEKLQATLSERSREFRSQTQPVTLEAVRAALPAGTALVEFARFKSVDQKDADKFEDQYAAYILLPDGRLRWAGLGKAEAIERVVEDFRQALSNPRNETDVRKLARRMDEMVMRPVRAQLGTARQVFLAPDGELNLIPFAALMDERGRYLVEDYLFIYLTSGRDLLRLQANHEGLDDVLIFAAPDYDDDSGRGGPNEPAKTAPADDGRTGRRSATAVGRFAPLVHGAAEAEAIKSQWPQARLFLGKGALESAFKQVRRPRILHAITHGVFLEDQTRKAGGREAAAPAMAQGRENPLLRSWLVFAGANHRRSGAEDGILTAYEAAALDLWGTKLVVLSACETGVGEVKNGEGVHGLRRALVMAGAETQLTSLWKVDDEVTKDLMKEYYGKLRNGAGRAAALREVQLRMLQDPARRDQRYWAGFIQLGEWANLDGVRPASRVQRATRKR